MNDEKIIDLFFERSEQAINELDIKYGRICNSVARNILNDREDAEECVNEAYLALWNAVPPTRPDPLAAFLCRIVRNISLKRLELKNAEKRKSNYDIAMDELEDCIAASSTVEEELEANELKKLIESFLDSLSRENRVIFMRRYWFSDSYSDIAERVGLSEKNVSVRLTRIRKELKKYLCEREVFI